MGCAWLARLSDGSDHQDRCQRLFFISLVLVGGATMAALHFSPLCWLVSAVTFTLMIMVVVCDFSRSRQADPYASGF